MPLLLICSKPTGLPAGPAAYRRGLWTYNLGIRNCPVIEATCLFGPKGVLLKLGSYLLKHLELERNADNLNTITDNCMARGRIGPLQDAAGHRELFNVSKLVEKWFPHVGKIRLPCDRDFGRIVKYIRNREPVVYTPEERSSLLRETCNNKHLFVVTKMKHED
jgi:hypothetical protein